MPIRLSKPKGPLWEGALEYGERIVHLEALAEPNGTFIADLVVIKAAETREIVMSPPSPK